jgi:protein-S-isoprenylcysteine O-methyltransferase Ste14
VRRRLAAVGSAVFFVVGPGVVAGLVPWLLTGWQMRQPVPYWAPVRVVGVIMLAAGLIVLTQAFARFVAEGLGTPAPNAPPQRLVVGGAYRYVRNPMYVALLAVIVGQALLLGQLGLLLYATALWLFAAAVVRWYEEPGLRRRFGADYDAYRRAVPAWWPRLHPWTPSQRDGPGARTVRGKP